VGVKVWLGYNYKGEVGEGEAWRMARDFMRPITGSSIWEGLGSMMRMKFEDGSALNFSVDEETQAKSGLVQRYLHVSTASYPNSVAKECMDRLDKTFGELGLRYREFIRQGLAPRPLLHRVWKLSPDEDN